MFFQVIGYGAISYAPSLDEVANRRIANEWGLQSVEGYDLLIAPADCSLLGRDGWLMVGDEVYTVIVVDCENGNHAGMMADRGLLLDQPREDLVSKYGWLVLKH